jgi:hypothetical protein
MTVGQVFLHNAKAMGLTIREAVALRGRMRSKVLQLANGYRGSWNDNPAMLSNSYFRVLLDPNTVWTCTGTVLRGDCQSSRSANVYMTMEDMALRWEPSLYAVADEFASNNTVFLQEFGWAWTKLVTMDRFSGPNGNLCHAKAHTPAVMPPDTPKPPIGGIIGAGAAGLVLGCLIGYLCLRKSARKNSEYQRA